MRGTFVECERTGHADGLAAGLALALGGLPAEAAPGSVAAVPTAAVPPAAAVLRHDLAAREGVSFVRPRARRDTPAPELTAVAARLAAVRLGVGRRLVELVVEYLSGRVSGGEPTVRKQLVQGTLADAQVTADAARGCLQAAGDVPAAVADVHDRLSALDWEVARLLGASGYLGTGPARASYVSRLTASCWVPREVAP